MSKMDNSDTCPRPMTVTGLVMQHVMHVALRPSTCDFDAGGGDRPWCNNLLGQEDREDLNSKATLATAAADAATAAPAKPLAIVAAAAAAVAMISVAVVSLMESLHALRSCSIGSDGPSSDSKSDPGT